MHKIIIFYNFNIVSIKIKQYYTEVQYLIDSCLFQIKFLFNNLIRNIIYKI